MKKLLAPLILLLLTTSCYPEPTCVTRRGMDTPDLECQAFHEHESLAEKAWVRFVAAVSRFDPRKLDGWTVRVRKDVKWSEKYQRYYFKHEDFPKMLLWGITRHDIDEIHLADARLWTSVLVHEMFHVGDKFASHDQWEELGYNAVEKFIRDSLTELGQTEQPLLSYEEVPVSMPDGTTAHGVYDPEEAGDDVLTGAMSSDQ